MRKTALVLLLAAGLTSTLSGCFGLVAAGTAGGALVATDRRTSGAYVDDDAIELKAFHQINKLVPSAHVSVTSYNRVALITGEAPSQEAKDKVDTIVRGLPNVRHVYNYTAILPNASFSQRSQDTWITSKVRARLLEGKGYNPKDIKIVTERGVVYVMGLVSRQEGEKATSVISQTSGVKEVIKVFEYINEN